MKKRIISTLLALMLLVSVMGVPATVYASYDETVYEQEPNDTIYNAQPVEVGERYDGSLYEFGGDIDLFSFQLTEETLVPIWFGASGTNLTYGVMDSDGNVIATVPYLGQEPDRLHIYYLEILLAPGTYYAGVLTGGGLYSFRLLKEPQHRPCTFHSTTYVQPINPATCTTGGRYLWTCLCGDKGRKEAPVDPEAHVWDEGTVLVQADCTTEGIVHYTCTGCGAEEERIVWEQHSFEIEEIVKEPTLETQGVALYTCPLCGDSYKDVTSRLYHRFVDVKLKEYYEMPVFWAVDNGITAGTSEYTFSPFAETERCQIVTFLWRSAGCPEPETAVNPFADVKETDYFYKAVLWAVEEGITTGTGDDTFSPFAKCERGQVVTFLWRAAGSPAPAAAENPFADVNESHYFHNAVLWAVEKGITSGTDENSFSPFSITQRCQAVTFLYRADNQ